MEAVINEIMGLVDAHGNACETFGDYQFAANAQECVTTRAAVEARIRQVLQCQGCDVPKDGVYQIQEPCQLAAAQQIALPQGLHPRTADLVTRFAAALAEKLHASEVKRGYSDGWASPDWLDECRAELVRHVAKGDPRDVAAYCAFLWHHGAKTELAAALQGVQPFGYVNTHTGQFFTDVEHCRKNNEGHWRTVYTHPTTQGLDAAVLEALQAALVCMQEDAVAIEAEFGSGRGLAELDAAGELDPAIIKVRKVLAAQAKQAGV